MVKILSSSLILVLICVGSAIAQPAFTTGNLVVYRVGNGVDTLTSAGMSVSIDEYSTSGSFVTAHPLPIAAAGGNRRLIGSGSATTEGQLNRSTDKKYLLLTGYDTTPDPARLQLVNAPSTVINRVVGVFAANGMVDITTALPDAYSGNSIRGAASTDGTSIWLNGTGIQPSFGVRYTTKGSVSSSIVSASYPVNNIRALGIFNGQLYCTTGSGAYKGISTVGTGLPTDSANIVTVLPGFPNTTDAGPDPYAFSIKPGSGDIAYVADGRSKNRGGGVQKWILSGGTWTLAYTLDSVLTTGVRALTVDWSATPAIIYATSGENYTKNQPGNKIVSVTDIDSAAAFSILATADINTMFRGIEFAPIASITAITYTFTGDGNWDVATNWSNNTIPPAMLPANNAIVIDHVAGGQCILNVTQNVSTGATLTVMTGKNLIVPGTLSVQ